MGADAPLRRLSPYGTILLALLIGGCSDAASEAVERGDTLLGEGKPEAAIAEYKLALRRRPDDAAVIMRLGHAYAVSGEIDGALQHYVPLLELDSAYRYQIAADLVDAARAARDRGSRANMVRALTPLLEQGAGWVPPDLRLDQARYHWEQGDYDRALPLYLSVLGEPAESPLPTTVWFETARAFEEIGGCREALTYFSGYLERTTGAEADLASAQWHYGRCLYDVAEADWEAARGADAINSLDRLIELGVPRTLLDRAHFLKGEVLLATGMEDEALAEFMEVLRLNPARSGPLVVLAEERVRELRYR